MDSILTNTINALGLFSDTIKKSLIFHIPHSGTIIPFDAGFDQELIKSEHNLLTDHATDQIFNIKETTQLVFPHSRIFCDVERLDDSIEPMAKVGRGYYYTKTDDGRHLRENDQHLKQNVYENFYLPHHEKLSKLSEQKINEFGQAIIIDCHSFSDTPFKTDLDQSEDRPDICIGTDEFHTPTWLVEFIRSGVENEGLSVKINSPYSGTIVPQKFYLRDDRLISVMVEINRRLYMKGGEVDNMRVRWLNEIFEDLFS